MHHASVRTCAFLPRTRLGVELLGHGYIYIHFVESRSSEGGNGARVHSSLQREDSSSSMTLSALGLSVFFFLSV